jgi:small neutral amino acid transporter SnatA (MarC family)
MRILTRLMGLVLSAIAVQFILDGQAELCDSAPMI